MTRCIVIGSGPSGMACTVSLLARGAEVTMIDIGRDLTPAHRERIDAIAAKGHADWSPEDRAWMTGSLKASRSAVPLKALFGDEFMYGPLDEVFGPGRAPAGFALRSSRAVGGLSRVWGGTLGRLDARDLEGWPISPEDLSEHYDAIEALIPSIGGDRAHPDQLSPQAAWLLSRWAQHEDALAALHAQVQPAWLAVDPHCQRCGNCLHGCPYGYIFSTAEWTQSSARGGFTYRSGLHAIRLQESATEGRVQCVAEDGTVTSLSADRIFVGTGVIATPQLMLASLGNQKIRLTLRDSQYFLLPFAIPKGQPKDAPHHTLSQLFMRIDDPALTAARVHVQFYTYNDLYAAKIAGKTGPLSRWAVVRRLSELLGRHMVLAIGYLHSRESRTTVLGLAYSGGRPVLSAEAEALQSTGQIVRRVWARLARIGRIAGLIPMSRLGEIADFGIGYHCGGTFPMSGHTGDTSSDIYGRPAGFRRIHIIDASCWPTIPAAPVTLTVMANAHRIGSLAMSL